MTDESKRRIIVCDNVDCRGRGSLDLYDRLWEKVEATERDDITIQQYTCFGGCQIGPNVIIYPERIWYCGVREEDLDEIVAHVCGGPRVERLEQGVDQILKMTILGVLDAGGWGSY